MVQKGVRYRYPKHPTNLRSVPGRPGNGTRPLFEPCRAFDALSLIQHTLTLRSFEAFCVNEAGENGAGAVIWASVKGFLDVSRHDKCSDMDYDVGRAW